MNEKRNLKKLKNYIRKEENLRYLIIGAVIVLLIFWAIMFITEELNYNFSINKYESYIDGYETEEGIFVEPINKGDLRRIYNKLQTRDYNSFLYGFNLGENTSPLSQNGNIYTTLNVYPESNLNNSLLNIYEYDKGSNTFNCLGEARVINNAVSFITKSTGEHFIALVNAPTYDIDNEKLAYNEEFNYIDSLRNNWNYDIGNNNGWGNNEKEYYTESEKNSNIQNGVLNITALKEYYNGSEYTSARLVSKENFLYGKFEISAKLPKGDGLWPAIWMLPSTNTYGDWPNSGEIDIMESIGREPNYIHGSLQMNAFNFKANNQKTSSILVNNIYSGYHNYGLLWTPNKIELSVDNDVYFTYDRDLYDTSSTSWDKWPYNEAFNLILNVAVGGTYGGDVDNSIFPQTMSIDSIKVYDLGLSDYGLNKVY